MPCYISIGCLNLFVHHYSCNICLIKIYINHQITTNKHLKPAWLRVSISDPPKRKYPSRSKNSSTPGSMISSTDSKTPTARPKHWPLITKIELLRRPRSNWSLENHAMNCSSQDTTSRIINSNLKSLTILKSSSRLHYSNKVQAG